MASPHASGPRTRAEASCEPTASDRLRVLELLKHYGWNATSFQVLESHFQYWFDEGGEACVAFVDTGSAWVAAGAPIASDGALPGATSRFLDAAARRRRRGCFFGVETRFVEATGLGAVHLGEQPTWDPGAWQRTLSWAPSLREQLRRPLRKGVTVRQVPSSELQPDHPMRVAVEALLDRWLEARALPPMRFVVELEPFVFASEKRYWVAERNGTVVGFLAAAPVYQRKGWLLEDLVRDANAPNGTSELLIDQAMRAADEDGSAFVTLGLVPLSGPIGLALRAARFFGQGLYDFEGLRRFKAKLKPAAWTPIALALPKGRSRTVGVYDALCAFAGGGLLRFALRALLAGPALLVYLLAALLVPWTALLAWVPPAAWFPSALVRSAWVAFDALLAGALFWLGRRWRGGLGATLASVVTLDAGLTMWEAASFNLPRIHSVGAALGVGIGVLAPSAAAVLLWRAVLTQAKRARH